MTLRMISLLAILAVSAAAGVTAAGEESSSGNLHAQVQERDLPYVTVRVRCVDERGKHLYRHQMLIYYPANSHGWSAKWYGGAINIPSKEGALPAGRLFVIVPGYERAEFDLSGMPVPLTATLRESRLPYVRFEVRDCLHENIRAYVRYGLEGSRFGREFLRAPGWLPDYQPPDMPLPACAPMIADGVIALFARSGMDIVHPGHVELRVPGERVEFSVESVPVVRFVLPQDAKIRRGGLAYSYPVIARGGVPAEWDSQRLRDYGHWTLTCGPRRAAEPADGGDGWTARLPVGIQYHFIVGSNRVEAGVDESELWYGERKSREEVVTLLGGALVETAVVLKLPEENPAMEAVLFPGTLPADAVAGRRLDPDLHGRRLSLRGGRGSVMFPASLALGTVYSDVLGVAYVRRQEGGSLVGSFFMGVVELVPAPDMSGLLSVTLKPDDGDSGVARASSRSAMHGRIDGGRSVFLRGYPAGKYRAHLRLGTREWWQSLEAPSEGTVRVHLKKPD